MESSPHDRARMTRGCVSSEKRPKNRTLSDMNKGERNGREVGGALWNPGDYCWSSAKVCAAPAARGDSFASFPAVRCGRVSSFPPLGCLGEGVRAFLLLGFKTLGIPSLYCLSPSCSWTQHGVAQLQSGVTDKALGGSAAKPRKEPGPLND